MAAASVCGAIGRLTPGAAARGGDGVLLGKGCDLGDVRVSIRVMVVWLSAVALVERKRGDNVRSAMVETTPVTRNGINQRFITILLELLRQGSWPTEDEAYTAIVRVQQLCNHNCFKA